MSAAAIAAAMTKLSDLLEIHDHYFCADKNNKKVGRNATGRMRTQRWCCFPAQSRLQDAVQHVTQALEGIDDEGACVEQRTDACKCLMLLHAGGSNGERATLAYIRGRALDVFEHYCAEAEDLLARSVRAPWWCNGCNATLVYHPPNQVKLDPQNVDAWNSLGHCFWKKGDLDMAQTCFTTALEHVSHTSVLTRANSLPSAMQQTVISTPFDGAEADQK